MFIDGIPDPVGTTANHLFWSETRQQFVRADELARHESLRTLDGIARVEKVVPRASGEPVYNLEVQVDHVYHVSQFGVLVHNGTATCKKGYVYEITGTLNGQRTSYVGSAFEHRLAQRLSGPSHPARKLLDKGDDLKITIREVSLKGAGEDRRNMFQILRTNEQQVLNKTLRETKGVLNGTENGWKNLNRIRARAESKYADDFEKWGNLLGEAEEFDSLSGLSSHLITNQL